MNITGLRTVLGVGIDVLSLARFEAVLERRGVSNVVRKICSDSEMKLWEDVKDDAQIRFLSSRWTVKEAAHKAVSPLFPSSPLSLKSYSLSHDPSGRPLLALTLPQSSAPGDEEAGDYLTTHPFFPASELKLLSSISHDAGIVTAVVIAGLERSPEWYTEPQYLSR